MDANKTAMVHPVDAIGYKGRYLALPTQSWMTPVFPSESEAVVMGDSVRGTVQFPESTTVATAPTFTQHSPHHPLVRTTTNPPRTLLDTTFSPIMDDPLADQLGEAPAPPMTFSKQRYYSHALSNEDKTALAIGDQNHNLKSWGPEDAIHFHQGRLDLAHQGVADRDVFVVARERELQDQQAKNAKKKKVRKFFSFGLLEKSKSSSKGTDTMQNPFYRSSRPSTSSPESEFSLQNPSTSSLVGEPSLRSVPATSLQSPSPRPRAPKIHVRTPSTGDYFSRCRQPKRHISSPLTQEVGCFTARPDITFDSFLSPHISGKGEAFRGADNAIKTDENGDKEDETKFKARQTARLTNTLSKMSSMPMLRGRKSTKSLKSVKSMKSMKSMESVAYSIDEVDEN